MPSESKLRSIYREVLRDRIINKSIFSTTLELKSGYGIEILHERFRTINKEKHSIHNTAWSDSEMKRSPFSINTGNWTICVQPLKLYKTVNVQPFELFMSNVWTHLSRSCWQTWPNNPPIRFMFPIMDQISYLAVRKEFRKTPIGGNL